MNSISFIKSSNRSIALFFVFTFLNTLVPYNILYANNNGPKAPEAGSFEPVDATDMVNLLTGDLSYVLPLMNIPSPEGGYPISLAYHAGIAMDQEASWVGLGWNLNPGVINRSVNGFPDDYANTKIYEHFYDEGGSEEFFTAGVSYTDPTGVATVGLNFSWGTNKAFGGSVSVGLGIPLGKDGAGGTLGISASAGENSSVGVGYTTSGGLSVGVDVSNSGVGGSLGFNSNGGGFSISANSSGNVGVGLSAPSGKNNSIGLNFSFSEGGVGISGGVTNRDALGKAVGGAGVGVNLSFANTIEQGDYTVNQSGWMIPLFVPTNIGTFGAYFGKQKVDWNLNNTVTNIVFGQSNFNTDLSQNTFFTTCNDYILTIYDTNNDNYFDRTNGTDQITQGDPSLDYTFDNLSYIQAISMNGEILLYSFESQSGNPRFKELHYRSCYFSEESVFTETTMDVYEFPLDKVAFTNLEENNAVFPNHDGFDLNAQGLSGSISSHYYENGNLFGIMKNHTEYDLKYSVNGGSQNNSGINTFESRPEFYFDNEFSTYLGTSPATFNTSSINSSILDYHQSSDPDALPRRKVSKHVEYFTNEEIHSTSTDKYVRGYMKPEGFADIGNPDPNGIGAFTVTGSNGKRYHYSIPVYNHVNATRNIGGIKNNDGTPKPEGDAYFERLQDTPYATHWLLTAITGPDYVDVDNDNMVSDEDYGYWVGFDYGKWSEAYGWKTPYGEDYIMSKDDDDFKTRIEGFKEVYYLDAIKTRTHTAIFSKSLREDSQSYRWQYKSIDWAMTNQDSGDFDLRFDLPSQKSLKLDRVILLKNEDAVGFTKSTGNLPNNSQGSRNILFLRPDSTVQNYQFNREDSVYDYSDIPSSVIDKAIKVVEMYYDDPSSSLVSNSPYTSAANTGRLTLTDVAFNGKGNTGVLPPYSFDYENSRDFDVDKKNAWGYYEDEPWMWSLKEILTPEGGKINIEYESDDFYKPALQNGRLFSRFLKFTLLDIPPTVQDSSPSTAPKGLIRIKVEVDDEDIPEGGLVLSDYFQMGSPFYMDFWHSAVYNHSGAGYDRSSVDIDDANAEIVSMDLSENSMIIRALASSPNFRDQFQSNAFPISFKGANAFYGEHIHPVTGHLVHRPNQKKGRYNYAWVSENGDGNHRYSLIFKIVGNKEVYDQVSGDLRVKLLTTSDGVHSYRTDYYYHKDGYESDPSSLNYRSSGTVSYIPNEDNNAIPYASELPAPKVMYEYVTVASRDNTNTFQGSTRYHFNVMKDKDPNAIKFGNFLEITDSGPAPFNNDNGKEVDIATVMVSDNLASIGQVLDVETYNREGQILSRSENEYYAMDNRPNDQGVDQQSYQTYKEITYKENLDRQDKWLVNSSTRRNYAQALRKSVTTRGGLTVTTLFDSYDEISGGTTGTTTFTSNGLTVKNKITPAFRVPEYNSGVYGMGSKVKDVRKKNMLSQEASSLTYIEEDSDRKILGASITTWDSNWRYLKEYGNGQFESSLPDQADRVWRKESNYIWEGSLAQDGGYLDYNGEFDGFDWGITSDGVTSQAPQWKEVGRTTLYDRYSMPLETKDINDNYASTRMSDFDSKILSISNARYGEQMYSGLENSDFDNDYYADSQVLGKSRISSDFAHTGLHSAKVTTGDNTLERVFGVVLRPNTYRSGDYKMSVWVHKDNYANARFKRNYAETGIAFTGETVFAGDWVQLNQYFTISGTSSDRVYGVGSASGTIYADDLRVHPVQSSMSSYVYNAWDELEYILGSNNMATKYEYDAAGRLSATYVEVANAPNAAMADFTGGFKKAAEYHQNYKRSLAMGGDNQSTNVPLDATSITLGDIINISGNNRAYVINLNNLHGGVTPYDLTWYYTNSAGNYIFLSNSNATTQTITHSCDGTSFKVKCVITDSDDPTNTITKESATLFYTCN